MQIWKYIHQHLKENKNLLLLYVLESKGSSPGRQGFCMAISEDGDMMGSIGGGIMEHKLVELAKANLEKKQLKVLIKKQIHSKSVPTNQSGMICSGEQTIAFIPLSENDLSSIEDLTACLLGNEEGHIHLSPSGFSFIESTSNKSSEFSFIDESNWSYSEKISFKKFAYIIGGGHVGKALTKILIDLKFHVTIIDDRAELHTMNNDKYAHKKITANYATIQEHIPNRKDVYMFIMTFGYRADLEVLQQLINHDVAFKGMMGSKEKIKQLLDEMKVLGYSEKQLKTVTTPIGLDIKSRTPEEIAISIAAQLIQQANKDLP